MTDRSDADRVTTAPPQHGDGGAQALPMEERAKVSTQHRTSSGLVVEEASGTAAAEATGKLQPDNEAPPEKTAGSG